MAFRIAVSGLNASSTALDVAGNNISNAGTTGFKTSRAEFGDLFATSNLGAPADAVGQGVKLTSISQQFTQGNVTFTDNGLDLAINGDGFFALEDAAGARAYSRAGAFGVDKDGFVVNPTGHRLQAFAANTGVVSGVVDSLQLTDTTIQPRATTQMLVDVNLDASAAIPTPAFDPALTTSFNDTLSTSVFDSLGVQHEATMFFRRTGTNTWQSHLRIDADNTQTLAPVNLSFDAFGALTTPMPINYGAFTPTTGANPFTVSFDLTGSSQFQSDFGVNRLSQDGFTTGRLNAIDIDETGVVFARFTNGQSQAQGQVVLANFANPQGLRREGDTTWSETTASGPPLVGAPLSASLGLIQAGALEESTTDITGELVNVIIAQRNFQANAQMIQAEDQITQTIINIR